MTDCQVEIVFDGPAPACTQHHALNKVLPPNCWRRPADGGGRGNCVWPVRALGARDIDAVNNPLSRVLRGQVYCCRVRGVAPITAERANPCCSGSTDVADVSWITHGADLDGLLRVWRRCLMATLVSQGRKVDFSACAGMVRAAPACQPSAHRTDRTAPADWSPGRTAERHGEPALCLPIPAGCRCHSSAAEHLWRIGIKLTSCAYLKSAGSCNYVATALTPAPATSPLRSRNG